MIKGTVSKSSGILSATRTAALILKRNRARVVWFGPGFCCPISDGRPGERVSRFGGDPEAFSACNDWSRMIWSCASTSPIRRTLSSNPASHSPCSHPAPRPSPLLTLPAFPARVPEAELARPEPRDENTRGTPNPGPRIHPSLYCRLSRVIRPEGVDSDRGSALNRGVTWGVHSDWAEPLRLKCGVTKGVRASA
eukprot:576043-Rhodomonas_salina.2